MSIFNLGLGKEIMPIFHLSSADRSMVDMIFLDFTRLTIDFFLKEGTVSGAFWISLVPSSTLTEVALAILLEMDLVISFKALMMLGVLDFLVRIRVQLTSYTSRNVWYSSYGIHWGLSFPKDMGLYDLVCYIDSSHCLKLIEAPINKFHKQCCLFRIVHIVKAIKVLILWLSLVLLSTMSSWSTLLLLQYLRTSFNFNKCNKNSFLWL